LTDAAAATGGVADASDRAPAPPAFSTTRTDPVVAVRGLGFGYAQGSPVLAIERLEVAACERVMVFGPSGCGKSTLLAVLAGVLAAPPGQVTVLGRDLGAMSSAERDRFRGDHIGFVFQLFNLIPYLSAADNIALPCRLSTRRRERLGGQPLESAVVASAERLGIDEILGRLPAGLSVGQQQRVAAARALIGAPELVLADEPTSALDADHRDRFLDLLFESCAGVGATLVFVSHDRELMPRFDRTLSLSELNRVASGQEPAAGRAHGAERAHGAPGTA